MSETLRQSFRFASIAIGGVLAAQLAIAADYYLSGSLLIAAGQVGILAAGSQDPGPQDDGLNRSALARFIQAGKTRRRLYLEPVGGRSLAAVRKLDGE
jgi:hypothetical protein